MANYTSHYNLKKPVNTESYNVEDANGNADLLDAALYRKSDTSHTHDDRYYTESEADTLLSGKSSTGHTHDDRYYTESEADTLLSGKSSTGHTHTKTEVGLGNVDNTSDADKPIGTATQTALALKANTADVYSKSYADTLLDAKQNKGVVLSSTISTTWTGSDVPYTQTLTLIGVSDMTETTGVHIGLASTATSAQVQSWNGLGLQAGSISGSGVTLRAFGSKNEIELPISIMILN